MRRQRFAKDSELFYKTSMVNSDENKTQTKINTQAISKESDMDRCQTIEISEKQRSSAKPFGLFTPQHYGVNDLADFHMIKNQIIKKAPELTPGLNSR